MNFVEKSPSQLAMDQVEEHIWQHFNRYFDLPQETCDDLQTTMILHNVYFKRSCGCDSSYDYRGCDCTTHIIDFTLGCDCRYSCDCTTTHNASKDAILKALQILIPHNKEYVKESLEYLNKYATKHHFLDRYKLQDGAIIVYPPHNKGLIEGVAQIGNKKLDDIIHHFYRSSSTFQDKKNALQNLYQNHIKASKFNIGLISDDTKAFYEKFKKFVEVRCKHAEEKISKDNAKIKIPDEKEVQVFFDIGLAIVRLIKIYENSN